MPIYKEEGIKKDGLQKYRVRINYTDSAGKARQLTRAAYGMDAARDLERRLEQEIMETPAASHTIQTLYEEYKLWKRSEVRESTYEKACRILQKHVLPQLGSQRIRQLDQHLQVLVKWKDDISSSGLGIKTKQNIYAEFRAMLNYGVRMRYIPSNPLLRIGNFKDVNLENAAPAAKRFRYYTPAQFLTYKETALQEAQKAEDYRYFVFFCIAFYTGMRKGEIHALRWSDIRDGCIHVERSISQKIKGKPISETAPKNASSIRVLQVPAPLKAILEEHKARQQKDPRFTESYRVCGATRCLGDTSIDNKNRTYAAAAGLPRITIH